MHRCVPRLLSCILAVTPFAAVVSGCAGFFGFDEIRESSPVPDATALTDATTAVTDAARQTCEPVKEIAAGSTHTCALTKAGAVRCWGDNGSGQLGIGNQTSRVAVDALDVALGQPALHVWAGAEYTCVQLADRSLTCFGNNEEGALGLELPPGDFGASPLDFEAGFPRVDLGDASLMRLSLVTHTDPNGDFDKALSCAVLSTGRVKCWGYNREGSLGYGDRISRGDQKGSMGENLPTVPLGAEASEVAVGVSRTCAIVDGGSSSSVKCWGRANLLGVGRDGGGVVGDRDSEVAKLPSVDLAGTPVLLAAGQFRTCAILGNATVKCWGPVTDSLQDGSIIGDQPNEMGDALAPLDVGDAGGAVDLTAAPGLLCVRFEGGRAKCVGTNPAGQLGRPADASDWDLASAPYLDLGAQRTIRAMAAGAEVPTLEGGVRHDVHVCALLDDESVKCWGHNVYGQLGFIGPPLGAKEGDLGDRLPPLCLPTR